MPRIPSRYTPIWRHIKDHGRCTISCHPLLFARLTKAVIKRKHLDSVFSLLNDHDDLRLVIHRNPDAHRITFILKQRLGIEGVVHEYDTKPADFSLSYGKLTPTQHPARLDGHATGNAPKDRKSGGNA